MACRTTRAARTGTTRGSAASAAKCAVVDGLGPQLKPNGWADEAAWAGEFPELAQHVVPVVTATGHRVTNGPPANRGKFIDGTVTVDYAHNPGTFLSNLWWVRTNSNTAPPNTSGQWNSATFTAGQPDSYHIQVPNQNTSNYFVLAQDSAGVYSAPKLVRF